MGKYGLEENWEGKCERKHHSPKEGKRDLDWVASGY